jgi:hypothetical protein
VQQVQMALGGLTFTVFSFCNMSSLYMCCFVIEVSLCLLRKSFMLMAQFDLKGQVQVLNIPMLTSLCLYMDVQMFSFPSSPELPFFMVNRLSPLSSKCSVENSV